MLQPLPASLAKDSTPTAAKCLAANPPVKSARTQHTWWSYKLDHPPECIRVLSNRSHGRNQLEGALHRQAEHLRAACPIMQCRCMLIAGVAGRRRC